MLLLDANASGALTKDQLTALRNGAPNAVTQLGNVANASGSLNQLTGPGGDSGDSTVQNEINRLNAEMTASSQIKIGAVTNNSDLSDVTTQLITESQNITTRLGAGMTIEQLQTRLATLLTNSQQFADGGLTNANTLDQLMTQLEAESISLNNILAGGGNVQTQIDAGIALFNGLLPALGVAAGATFPAYNAAIDLVN